jgi:hypothetical protein
VSGERRALERRRPVTTATRIRLEDERDKSADVTAAGGRTRRDRLGRVLFAVSAVAVILMGIVLPRLGRLGYALQTVATGILFGRALQFIASGAPRRLRRAPRVLLFVELVVDGVATFAGCRAWIGRSVAGRSVAASPETPAGPKGEHRGGVAGKRRAAQVTTITAVASVALHTLRLAIYLSPTRGVKHTAVAEK